MTELAVFGCLRNITGGHCRGSRQTDARPGAACIFLSFGCESFTGTRIVCK
jgi:hypothetical protein